VTGNPRVAALGAVVGAVVTLLAVLVVYGAAWAVNAMFPSPDANIGLGLATLVTTAVLIPLGVWLVLRRLRVRVAGPIAAGTAVVYLVVLFVPVSEPLSAARLAVLLALAAGYTGVAVWLAGRR
jgi:hypothetical protein